jgi:uncharacterized protein
MGCSRAEIHSVHGSVSCQHAVRAVLVLTMAAVHSILLLSLSNVFMTVAWYAHLRDLREKPWIVAALVSWGIALLEYLVQVPANRIGYQVFSLSQLKILQEVITLVVFVPFAVFFMKEKLSWNYLGAAACLAGAVFFIFRK